MNTPDAPPLYLNQTPLPCPAGLTLAALLEAQGIAPETVATAVNGRFVPRPLRGDTLLAPGDQVLTFQPITGG